LTTTEDNPVSYYVLAWSHDGQRIAFSHVTPQTDAGINVNGFLSPKVRNVNPPPGNPSLPQWGALEDRVIQYGTLPFPRDTNFVGFKQIPHDALSIAPKTAKSTIMDNPITYLRLNEVNLSGMKTISVENIYNVTGYRPPSGIDYIGEHLIEGNVPLSAILKTYRLNIPSQTPYQGP
jgi:hypothetical protein